jgi:hypothetical protein
MKTVKYSQTNSLQSKMAFQIDVALVPLLLTAGFLLAIVLSGIAFKLYLVRNQNHSLQKSEMQMVKLQECNQVLVHPSRFNDAIQKETSCSPEEPLTTGNVFTPQFKPLSSPAPSFQYDNVASFRLSAQTGRTEFTWMTKHDNDSCASISSCSSIGYDIGTPLSRVHSFVPLAILIPFSEMDSPREEFKDSAIELSDTLEHSFKDILKDVQQKTIQEDVEYVPKVNENQKVTKVLPNAMSVRNHFAQCSLPPIPPQIKVMRVKQNTVLKIDTCSSRINAHSPSFQSHMQALQETYGFFAQKAQRT